MTPIKHYTMDYTTQKNYTYKGLNREILTGDEIIILEAAPEYRYLKVITITEHHWNHLKQELKVKQLSQYGEQEIIYQNCQGIIASFPKHGNTYYDIVIDTSDKLGKALLDDLNKFDQHKVYSLEKLIDPNYGGIFNQARMDYIDLIHHG